MGTVETPVRNLRVGDMLAGSHGKGTRITHIEYMQRGCKNVHVNKTMCFDRIGFALTTERGAA